jgi:hypothetical protein
MEIKYTIQGLLIYITVAAYLLAFLTALLRRGTGFQPVKTRPSLS